MMEYPNFSVLMSVYFKEKAEYLEKSLSSLVHQTVTPTEIVIVKDGSLTDELNSILEKYSKEYPFIHCYGYEKNRGLGLALNFGVEKCQYDIIARMDSDDISREDRFEIQLKTLLEKKVDLLGSNTKEFIDDITNVQSTRIMPESHEEIMNYSKTRNPFVHPSIMTYKEVILSAGNFRNFYLCEDYDMWVRILEKGYTSYNIQDVLVYMRVGKDFYKRRGGLKYCKAIISFKKMMYKKGYIKYRQYFKTKYATIVVSLMPGFLREFVYKKFLRK
ncbi:MAG: glycosyltransferase [Anaeroplasmataceae bacterium]|nr:glycosyltransferase [Anaeroplasmataceae bacterium]